MLILLNEKFLKPMTRILNIAQFGLLFLMAGAAFLMIRTPANTNQAVLLSYVFLLVMIVLTVVLTTLSRRYLDRNNRPRADKALVSHMKGVGKSYRLYSYYFPADHVLVGPAGVFAVVVRSQAGKYVWNEKRRALANIGGPGLLANLFFQDSVGRPDAEANAQAQKLTKWLQSKLGSGTPTVQPLVILLDPKADNSETKDAPLLILKPEQAKKHLRSTRGETLSREQLAKLDEMLKINSASAPSGE